MRFFNTQWSAVGSQSVLDICSALEGDSKSGAGDFSQFMRYDTSSFHSAAPTSARYSSTASTSSYRAPSKKAAPYTRVMPRALEIRVEALFNTIDIDGNAALSKAECETPQWDSLLLCLLVCVSGLAAAGKDAYVMMDIDLDPSDGKITIEVGQIPTCDGM